jgi:hypothetical protein
MDLASVLPYFHRFAAHHKIKCVARAAVSYRRRDFETAVTLECPTCHDAVTGPVAEADLSKVLALFTEEKRN